jgi:hypothetical protein
MVIPASQSVDAGQSQASEGDAVAAVCCCRCARLTLNRQWHSWTGMSDTGLIVPCMTELSRRYYVTITVDWDGGGDLPNRDVFAMVAREGSISHDRQRPATLIKPPDRGRSQVSPSLCL